MNTTPNASDPQACSESGRKDDTQKRRWDLLPWKAVGEVVDILTFGARQYAPDNWQHVPDARRRYFAAAQRHLSAWWDPGAPNVDANTGKSHLAHATCCLLFLLWFDLQAGPGQ